MSLIEYEVRDRVAVVTPNRPEQRNAQNAALLEGFDSRASGSATVANLDQMTASNRAAKLA